jgi:hypothetical protein
MIVHCAIHVCRSKDLNNINPRQNQISDINDLGVVPILKKGKRKEKKKNSKTPLPKFPCSNFPKL